MNGATNETNKGFVALYLNILPISKQRKASCQNIFKTYVQHLNPTAGAGLY